MRIFRRAVTFLALLLALVSCQRPPSALRELPGAAEILDKEIYRGSSFAWLVEDAETGEVLFERDSAKLVLVGSLRKMFDASLLLEELTAEYRFHTPIYRQGQVENGVLRGDLIMVASGDLTMGGRAGPDDTILFADIDHSEANTLGNSRPTPGDPLAGYRELARQVAASGIREVSGEVVVDDRLYEPFDFRGQFMANAVFVNDNMVDVVMSPSRVGEPANVVVSPLSQAFPVTSTLKTTAAGTPLRVALKDGLVSGELPIDGRPRLTHEFPYLQTFRITEPSDYARTVLVEQLREAGVRVGAAALSPNPTRLLPKSYDERQRVAVLVSPPLAEIVRYVLKVSYNLGAETFVMLLGRSHGLRTQKAALELERDLLSSRFGIEPSEYSFPDGSGGRGTRVTPVAVNRLLKGMQGRPAFEEFRLALPEIGVKGFFTEVPRISSDATLSGVIGQAFAKSGTLLRADKQGVQLRCRSRAGYLKTRQGRELILTLVVNDVGPFQTIVDTMEVSHDLDVLIAILWREL